MMSASGTALPSGACDAHCHVIGPHERFRIAASAGEIRSDSVAKHLSLLDGLGLQRALIVHPSSVYGDDHSALLNALAEAGPRYRGVAVAQADIADTTLERWKAAGVCALRFATVRDGQGRPFAGSSSLKDFAALAPRMNALGWHAQIWADCGDVVVHAPFFEKLGLPIVFDHMGKFDVAAGVNGGDFQRLCAMVREGLVFVKLTLCRNSRNLPYYADLRPFHDALVAANADQLLWGSDWPHLRMGEFAPNPSSLLALFRSWIDDRDIEERILSSNPAKLFGFTERLNP